LSNANVLDLRWVDEIGERIAQSVVDFFGQIQNQTLISRLKSYGIQMAISASNNRMLSESLKGKTLVVSGVFVQFSRDELKATIESHGGKVGSSISAKTDFVIAGDNMGPAKLEKAKQLNIPILSENDFMQLLVDNS
jgi:DNA ligase (NAD+)